MTTSRCRPSLLVLGLGNVLCGDDGLGVAATELLSRRYRLPDGARVLDGGTLGLALMSHIRSLTDVILVDAVRGEGPPGTLVHLAGDEVAPAARHRLSVHQVGVADLLDGLRLLNEYPQNLVLLGLVPETLALGLGLSPAVKQQLPMLVTTIVEEARRLGYRFHRPDANDAAHAGGGNPAARALGL